MYTWGYIKEAALAKLDLDIDEANVQGLLNKFYIYANEVITQICSSIKPKKSYYEIVITEDNIGQLLTIDDVNFISFGDDVSTISCKNVYGDVIVKECHDCDLVYKGYNQFICKTLGTYYISYNSRWYTFYSNTLESEMLNVPVDILECIPSYIAHQCYKVDDEYKSSVFRNEYEMFLARIDNTDFNNTKTFTIGGDW